MARFTVTIVEEFEYEFEIEADDAAEAEQIALDSDTSEATRDAFHASRILHPAQEIDHA